MMRNLAMKIGIAFCLLLGNSLACTAKESEPIVIARAYVGATLSGDSAQMIELLDGSVVAALESAAQRATDQIGGRRTIAAEEILQVTRTNPFFVIDSIQEISNDGERAVVEVIGVSGESVRLDLVRSESGWRVWLRVPAALVDTQNNAQ
jgi:hypothetical protein